MPAFPGQKEQQAAKNAGRKIITILNKSDLADKEITGRWLSILAGDKGPVLAFDAKKTGGLKTENLLLANRPQSMSTGARYA